MLSATIDGSFERSPRISSAAGHEEQPCDVNSSTTARGSAKAARLSATSAQTPSAPDSRVKTPRDIIKITETAAQREACGMKEKHTLRMREAGILIGCPSLARHSIRGEGLIRQVRRSDIHRSGDR